MISSRYLAVHTARRRPLRGTPMTTYSFRPEILIWLLSHGVRPHPDTRPALAFQYVNDLYRFELRRLKARRQSREVPAADYAGLVVELRRRYPLVSIPVREWTVPGTPGDPEDLPLC
jgi:hypothetical protein